LRILLVTESIPFPPRNGRELPTAEIFRVIAERAEVDLLVITNEDVDYQKRLHNLPKNINCIGKLAYSQSRSPSTRLLNEMRGEKPGYFSKKYNDKAVRDLMLGKQYDVVWVSPASLYTFIEAVRELVPKTVDKVAIGMNDLKSGMYYDAINEAIGFRTFHIPYFLRWMRSFFMGRAEKNYLCHIDFVHMQTQSEVNKVFRMFSEKPAKPTIFFAPNGRKNELSVCTYSGRNSNNILYMTQLNGERIIESRWFLRKVWPHILAELPEAQLLIPGKIADINSSRLSFLREAKNIKLLGFVENLPDLFEEVRLSVVPIFHGTGLINRILDNLTAGVPTVSTSNAGGTFLGLKKDEHYLCADTSTEFARQTVRLFQNNELSNRLSGKGREYAAMHPSWEDTALKIYKAISDEE
jgi:glycosyltransferase involved in cell wall biosynthesis